MDLPLHRVVRTSRHEWVIGEEDRPTNAKEFTRGINVAQNAMRSLGVDLGSDDCYKVRAGDGGQVILFVEIEETT